MIPSKLSDFPAVWAIDLSFARLAKGPCQYAWSASANSIQANCVRYWIVDEPALASHRLANPTVYSLPTMHQRSSAASVHWAGHA